MGIVIALDKPIANGYLLGANRYLGGSVPGGVVQEVVLAMLAKEPSHGYELRARLRDALGPVGEAMNAGQIYVTLGRLEKAGLVTCDLEAGQGPDRKVYAVTAAGQERVSAWLAGGGGPGSAP